MADGLEGVDQESVVQLIQQFMKENGLNRSLAALQEESHVSINTVDNLESFTNMIVKGEWDVVLSTVASLHLSSGKIIDLYEHIVIEMIERKEKATARAILRQTPPMLQMKQQQKERLEHLEDLLSQSVFDPETAFPEGLTKQQRRAQIAQSLADEVSVVPSSRLLSLLQQALKYQQHEGLLPVGSEYDLFRGTASVHSHTKETHPTRNEKTIQFVKGSNAECAVFSPDGQLLVTGSPDGFVEVWCFITGKLKKDLIYQAEDRFMMHEAAVLALAFSKDSELVASGDQEGCIKIWQLKTGKCIRKFPQAHSQGITGLKFHGTQILSTSFDYTIRTHGIKSGKTLNIFRGHLGFVNSACFVSNGANLVSGSGDGTVKIWDAKTHECLSTFRPTLQLAQAKGTEGEQKLGEVTTPVHTVLPLPRRPDSLVVCTKSATVYIMTTSGVVTKSFVCSEQPNPTVVLTSCVMSPKGEWIYCSGDDKKIYCFSMKTGKLEHTLDAHDAEIVGLAHHPLQNLLASFSVSGSLKLWKP